MIKLNYDLVEEQIHTEIDARNNGVVDIFWACPGVGFGHLIIDENTKEIIDDEFMSREFCDIVIKKTKGI